jgi:glycosyltransferase involved in cell wall biosynthesis
MTSPPASAAVSVVVPCRNAASTIDAQLAALADQDFDGALEIVVVDNQSTDGTARRVAQWQRAIPALRVVDARGRAAPAFARNTGIAAARHELVVACDADDVVDRAWARRLAESLANADVVAGGTVEWGGNALPDPPDPRPFGRAGFGYLPALSGSSFGVRKAAWSRLGGFDEELVYGEDIDFAWRAQLDGLRYASRPDAFVYHRVPDAAGELFRKWVRYGTYQPRLYRKFRGRALPRQPVPRALARWLLLAATSYRLVLGRAAARRAWCVEAGRRVGRVIGSVRSRTLYL